MIRSIAAPLLVALLFNYSSLWGQAQYSATAKLLLHKIEQAETSMLMKSTLQRSLGSFYSTANIRGTQYVFGTLDVLPGFNEGDVTALGVMLNSRIGPFQNVAIPLEALSALGGIAGIKYIEVSVRPSVRMDSARVDTKVDSVHAGVSPLTGAYTGKGVVVGVIEADST